MLTNEDKTPVTLTLKALRTNLGWSLEYASKLLGVSDVTLASYEKGDTYPTVPIIKRIEQVYDVSFNRINFLLDNDALSDKDQKEV